MIEYLRGEEEAIDFLETLQERPVTSVICVAELFAVARDAGEQQAIDSFLKAFDVVELDAQMARLGGEYRQTCSGSHGSGLADALIAAAANSQGLVLATFNAKHYPMVDEIMVPYDRT
jgi:predicted nucleic acid-binding protein